MAAPGAARPAVYFYGTFDKVQGLYASFDWFATDPVLISRFPNNSIDYVSAGLGLVGDMNRFGRCYLGFGGNGRSEEHTSELQSLMRTSYALFCLKKKEKY